MRQYMAKRYKERRAAAIAFLGGWCARCGSDEDLQFDHIFPHTKLYTIAAVPMASKKKFLAEIVKCQLLCPPCHRLKSGAEQSVGHGGGKSGKRNCLCDLCRARRAIYMRERYVPTERMGGRGPTPGEHGGGTQGIRKCKCDLCLQKRAEYQRARRLGM